MTHYSVHEPSSEAADTDDRAGALVFVKEGFCWPAFLLAPFWLIYHRLWIALLIYIAVSLGLGWISEANPAAGDLIQWIGLGLLILFGFEANDLRRYRLERRGYRLAGVAIGRDRDKAELNFFRGWLPQQGRTMRAPSRSDHAQPPQVIGGGEPEDVIGLFPNA